MSTTPKCQGIISSIRRSRYPQSLRRFLVGLAFQRSTAGRALHTSSRHRESCASLSRRIAEPAEITRPNAAQPRLSVGQTLQESVDRIQILGINLKFTGLDVNRGELPVMAGFKSPTNHFLVKRSASPSELLFAVATLDGCHDRSPGTVIESRGCVDGCPLSRFGPAKMQIMSRPFTARIRIGTDNANKSGKA